jgi:phage-related minor tail protein
MTDQLRNEIREITADLAQRIDTLSFTEISNLSEELLDRALLGEFLAYRASRKTAIEERLQQAANDTKAVEHKESTGTVNVKSTVPKVEEDPFPMNPEIKVLPHPDGPPMPKQAQESPTETMEGKAQAVKKESVPPEQRATDSAKPASIAEKAQQGNTQKSLHDRLAANNLSFGLNDRLAYVKNLFDGSTEDFNRVISQLNTFSNWEEADVFINEMVKPDYDWDEKSAVVERFLQHVKMRFE